MKHIFIIAIIIGLFNSCSSEIIEDAKLSEEISEEILAEREILKETSIIIGKIINNKEARNEMTSKMKIFDEKDYNISLHALMGHDSKMTYREQEKFSELQLKGTKESVFKKMFIDEVSNNEIEYPALMSLKKNLKQKGLHNKSNENDLDINAAIYIPYLDVNEDENELGIDFYVGYDPLTFEDAEVFKIDENGNIFDQRTANFEFVEDNRVVGIVPIDPCEYEPDNCNDFEMEPLVFDEQTNIYGSSHFNQLQQFDPHDGNPFIDDGSSWYGENTGGGGPTGGGNPNQGNEWDGSGNTQNTSYLMVTNENHEDFNDEDYLISTEFTAFRSKSSAWMRVFDRRLRLRFHFGRGEKLNVNENGTVTPGPESEHLASSSIRRRRAGRSHRWYDARVALDYDWSMRKVEQRLFVFTRHSIASNASVTRKAKYGVTANNGTVAPVAEDVVEVEINIQRSNSKYRATTPITRNFAFQYNVGYGPLPDDECLNYEGHCFFIHEMHHTSFILRHFITPKKN